MTVNIAYIFWEHMVEDLFGLALFSVIFLFLPKEFKSWANYALFIFIPGLISTAFPDLAYGISYVLRFGTLDAILQPHKPILTYEIFHSPASLVVVPLMLGLVYLLILILERAGVKVTIPRRWKEVVVAVSVLGVFIHLAFDTVGL